MNAVQVIFNFPSVEEAITGMARLRGLEASAGAPTPGKSATTAPLAAGKPAATAGPATAPAKTAQEPSASATGASAPADAYAPVKQAITDAVVKNKPVVAALLAEFGAKSGKDLKAEQYADFLAKLETAMNPAGDDMA